MIPLQKTCFAWVVATLGDRLAESREERTLRFLEEAIELAQAQGIEEKRVNTMTAYVYDRPVGEPQQEMAGCLFTLACLAEAEGVDIEHITWGELARVLRRITEVRAKHFQKPPVLRSGG